ncbi:DUF3426 domain-containing protein [Roseateles sp.]|uniref:zinc-ribbon and DUF3426 domain-containing protein n=1 Tax=Roseateles sp. TaxID=1971397 RepID=UPI003BA6A676
MSFATRCTACGTIFRVVEDQLRVSEGWVRCGRCAEVFDAREQLFDIDREAPPAWPAQSPAPAPVTAEAPPSVKDWHDEPSEPTQHSRHPSPAPQEPHDSWQPSQDPEPEIRVASKARPSEFAAAPASDDALALDPIRVEEARIDSRLDSRLEPQWVPEDAQAPAPTPVTTPSRNIEAPQVGAIEMGDGPDVMLSPSLMKASTAKAEPGEALNPPSKPASNKDAEAKSSPVPEFLRTKPSQSFWRRPAVRAGLSVTGLLLTALLSLQATLHFRDALAAQQPALRPALSSLCRMAACELQAWQHIESISVESSALNLAGPDNHYKLLVGLRNKGSAEVATPWVELSLTDASGTVLAKRSLRPTDLHAQQATLPAGSELNLQTLLSTGTLKVSGYSVEIFYP